MKRLNDTYQIAIIVFLVLIAFGGAFWNSYSLDDEFVTTSSNEKVAQGLDGLKEIFTTPYIEKSVDNNAYEYRPITMAFFAIEKSVVGFNPGISHLVNLVLYIGVILLIFKILWTLFPQEYHAAIFFIVLLFAVHPLHSEVVLSLKNREELLVSLLGFGALMLAIKYSREQKIILGVFALLLMVLGVFVKSTITPFVLVIPATLYFFKLLPAKKSIIFFLLAIASMGLASAVPRLIFDIPVNREISFVESPLLHLPFQNRLPMAFYAFLYYLKLHIVPYPLLSYYGYNHVSLLSWPDYQL